MSDIYTPKEGLVAAKGLLESTWTQKPRDTNQYCAATALSRIMFYSGDITPQTDQQEIDFWTAMRLLREAIGLKPDGPPEEVYAWNDADGRTKEEVLAAYDRAIEAASHGS